MEELFQEILDAFPKDQEVPKQRADFEKKRWQESRKLKDLIPRG
jgi:hypothetical protein